jgi:hypothetical protein
LSLIARILALAAASAVVLVPGALATTDPPEVSDVPVKITDGKISLGLRVAPRGNYARFIVQNVGRNVHTFTIGTAARGTGVQTGFDTGTLKPRQKRILILFLDYRGKLPYYSRIKADLKKPGMKGVFTIE